MPWLSMYHDANNKVGMKRTTSALMAKFGITIIPALVLLDERGRVICADGCGMCGADPEGLSFPWRKQPSSGRGTRAVLNFDLPAGERTQRPGSPARIRPASRPPRKKFALKQDPVSAVHTAGGLGSRGERLAGHPMPPARSTAATGAPGVCPQAS